MKKQVLKHAIALFILVAVAFAIELACFQWQLLGNQTGIRAFALEKLQKSGFSMQDGALLAEQDGASLRLPLSGEYVDKLEYGYQGEQDFTAVLEVAGFDRYGNSAVQEMQDANSAKLGRSVHKIGCNASSILLEVPKGTSITYIQTRNILSVNWIRLLCVFVTLIAAYFLIAFRALVARRVEIGFLALCLCIGVAYVAAAPIGFSSWDEQIHYKHTVETSQVFAGSKAYWTLAAAETRDLTLPKGADTWEEQQDLFAHLQSVHDKQNLAQVTEKPALVPYTRLAYLPQALLYGMADLFHLPFALCYMLGRLGNLLLYAFVMFFAIKILPTGKRIAAVLGLLPTPLFIASSYTYDAVVFAFLLLGFAAFLDEILHPQRKLTFRRAALMLGAMVFASLPKAVYIPLLLLVLLLPQEKFGGKRQLWLFRGAALLLFLLMMSTFVLPTLTNPSEVGDIRGGDTSTAKQLGVILGHPFAYLGLLLQSVGSNLFNFTLGPSVTLDLAYLGIVDSYNAQAVTLILLVFVLLTDHMEATELPRRVKIWLVVALAAVVALIWTALYLSFTPVGLPQINGVQARYYLPLLVPLYLLLHTRRIKCRVPEGAYHLLTLGTAGGISVYALYHQIIGVFLL